MITSGTPPGTTSPRRRLRLGLGIGAAVLGVTIAIPTSASAAAGTPPRPDSSGAPSLTSVELKFDDQGPYMAGASIEIKDRTYDRTVTTGYISWKRSKTFSYQLAPGTSLWIAFTAASAGAFGGVKLPVPDSSGGKMSKCFRFSGDRDTPKVRYCDGSSLPQQDRDWPSRP